MCTEKKQLEISRASSNVSDATILAAIEKKGHITKIGRLEAVTFVHDYISKKTISALTVSSIYEIITGPLNDLDTHSLRRLGWACQHPAHHLAEYQ